MKDEELYALARRVGNALKAHGLMLAAAESCTGGWIAEAVTAVPGSSAWFERGFVTYTYISKREMLGVREETLAAHGAVSEQTVREMAQGALARSHAQVAVAVSGTAGPSGGTSEKPVGTVCFAWAAQAGGVRAETRHFPGDREAVRRGSVAHALEGVAALLEGLRNGQRSSGNGPPR
ncbi:MAG: nicotinamide-nucleotide amidohydrolase family protein [Burkholderiales bacterium]|nr:nicotinamide-nucleotide amidohydrolase family protein [Burkholderiales bacterium]